jgi:hypothetical protein
VQRRNVDGRIEQVQHVNSDGKPEETTKAVAADSEGPQAKRACVRRRLQISPLRCPGFPVKFCGVDKVLASLYGERIRGRLWGSGYAPVEMTNSFGERL